MALEGAYAFDDVGSTTVVDLSGNGRHIDLTATNGAQVASGGVLDDGALGKTGVGTIPLPAALRVAIETDDRSLMFDAAAQRGTWWVRAESTALDTGVWGALSLDTTNVLVRARTQANASPSPASPVIGALTTGTRHNFAITYVRSTGVVAYYYDGAPVGTATHPPGTALYVGADDLNVAEWGDTGPALDNLRFYSHALTPSEVAALAGTPVGGATEVTGSATAVIGAPTATATGVRATGGALTALLGPPTATIVGTRTVVGATVADLGALAATVVGAGAVDGTALAALGPLHATVVVPGPLPATRIVVSGREPYRRVSGREPREAV